MHQMINIKYKWFLNLTIIFSICDFLISITIINNFNLVQLNKIGMFFCCSHWKYVSDNWSLLTLKVEGFGISRNMRTRIFNAFFLSAILQYVFYLIMQGKIICNALAKITKIWIRMEIILSHHSNRSKVALVYKIAW